ncbi:MAG: hypothetical protein LBM00_03225 [Deltaproteobacteria bacterium]|jgi:hypothetical protein|nr:hypothetical protein [Deltaproteobacteria bacterium]
MPISLKDRLLTGLNKDWLNRQKAFGTKAAVDYLSGLAKTAAELRNIQSADIRTIVDMEILTLEHEKELYGGEDPTVIPSLQAAIDSLTKDVKRAINTAEVPEDYRKAALTHSSKRQYHGIPIDGCHEAINSHITRLDNRIRTVGVSVPEKNSLVARKENMKQAKQIYITMQQQALRII